MKKGYVPDPRTGVGGEWVEHDPKNEGSLWESSKK